MEEKHDQMSKFVEVSEHVDDSDPGRSSEKGRRGLNDKTNNRCSHKYVTITLRLQIWTRAIFHRVPIIWVWTNSEKRLSTLLA